MTLNEEKLEASSFCKALYEQSIVYYNNFKAIESEYLKTCGTSTDKIEDMKECIRKGVDLIVNAKANNKTIRLNQETIKDTLGELNGKLDDLQSIIA
jgi:hypothetical protein